MNLTSLIITPELLKLITEIDEFKGSWKQIGENNPDQLSALRYVDQGCFHQFASNCL